MREQTEWVELVEQGVAKLTGTDANKIIHATQELARTTLFPKNLYGDGNSAQKIVRAIDSFLSA